LDRRVGFQERLETSRPHDHSSRLLRIGTIHQQVLSHLLERREEWIERRRGHVAELRKRTTEAEAKLNRLYQAIEDGIADLSDPALKDRLAELAAIRRGPMPTAWSA